MLHDGCRPLVRNASSFFATQNQGGRVGTGKVLLVKLPLIVDRPVTDGPAGQGHGRACPHDLARGLEGNHRGLQYVDDGVGAERHTGSIVNRYGVGTGVVGLDVGNSQCCAGGVRQIGAGEAPSGEHSDLPGAESIVPIPRCAFHAND